MQGLVTRAWGSSSREFIVRKSKQIEEKATSARSCNFLHGCREKARCFLWAGAQERNEDYAGMQKLGARADFRQTSLCNPLLCRVDWRKCPLKASGLCGSPWTAARALLQEHRLDAVSTQWVWEKQR